MKKFISLTLLVALLLSQIACSDNSEQQNETSSEDTSFDTTVESSDEISDDLPEVTFDGRTFTTLTYTSVEMDYVAEDTGDVVNDAVYKRNRDVMERFDIQLETVVDTYPNVNTLLTSSVMADDDEYQIVANHVVQFGGIAKNDLLMNWYDVPYVDFSKPWWSDSTVEDMTYKGVALLAVGDYSLSALKYTYCYFYDKQAAEEYHFENLYDVVYDGKWTLDYLMDLCRDIYVDLNGDGQRDGEDYYGFTSTLLSPTDAYLWSSGNKVFTKQSDGSLEYTYNTPHTVETIEKLYKLFYETDGVTVSRPQYPTAGNEVHFSAVYSFNDYLTAIIPGYLHNAVANFRERPTEYGILPYPKYDESQEKYQTMVSGAHAVLGIPKTVSDLEFVGIITEALNAESHKTVFPAYYETALKVKYSYDDESVKMLDMIVDSRVFDFGYVYDNWKGVSFFFERLMQAKSSDFSSYYATNGSAAESYYDAIIEYFEELAQNSK